MKRILIPLATINLQENSIATLHFARATYIRKLVKYDLMPIFVSHEMNESMINDLYESCDGVLFMGGSDFSSSLYNKEKHKDTNAIEPNRDLLELAILKRVLSDKKPFLGICRGCQALNIAAGGSLYQHLPDLVQDEEHGVGEGKTYDNLLTNDKHEILIERRSKIFPIFMKERIFVNSGHHQAIKNLGENLRVSAKSPAGVVEIIEHIDPDFFCFGIQSHPEAEENSFMEKVFAKFAKVL